MSSVIPARSIPTGHRSLTERRPGLAAAAALALMSLLAVPSHAKRSRQPRPFDRLLAALTAGRQQELRRAARLSGSSGALRALAAKERARVRAAIAAAPFVQQSWALLPALLRWMSSADRQLAAAAARSVRRIAEDLRGDQLVRYDEIPGALGATAVQLAEVAKNRKLAADIRGLAVLSLAQLRPLVELSPSVMLPLLSDPDARLRRAATELFALDDSPPARRELVRRVRNDSSIAVAVAAAATLCGHPGGSPATAAAVEALRSAGALARLLALTGVPDANADELLDIERCLEAIHDKRARPALDRLGERLDKLGIPH